MEIIVTEILEIKIMKGVMDSISREEQVRRYLETTIDNLAKKVYIEPVNIFQQ